MKILDNIKTKFANRKLNKLIHNSNSSRKIKTTNLTNAENVGLIYCVENEKDYKKIIKLINYLKGEFGIRSIKALIYFPFKEDPLFLQSKVSLDFFTKKHLSFSLEPSSTEAINFSNTTFDILIDLTANEFTPLKFITYKSKASLKIGKYSTENEPYYDLMIAEKNKDNFEEYINHIVSYVGNLKNA